MNQQEIEAVAKENGVRFRHFYGRNNKMIATIATKLNSENTKEQLESDSYLIDVGVSFVSTRDEPDKVRGKLISMGRAIKGSDKFSDVMNIHVFRQLIRDKSILDLFQRHLHPDFKSCYVRDCRVLVKDRAVPTLKHLGDGDDTVFFTVD